LLSPIIMMALQLQTVTSDSESTTLLARVAKVSSARTLRLAASLSLSRGCLSEWTRTPDSCLAQVSDRVTQAQPSQ
jgi:hypothetical protein